MPKGEPTSQQPASYDKSHDECFHQVQFLSGLSCARRHLNWWIYWLEKRRLRRKSYCGV